jgi:hypothetical protein
MKILLLVPLILTIPRKRKKQLGWPIRLYGNILINSSTAILEKLQVACDKIRTSLQKFSTPPDPVKMLLASQQLKSFQNRQWIYALLQNVMIRMESFFGFAFLSFWQGQPLKISSKPTRF